MAFGATTVSMASGAVSDIFGGIERAGGMKLQAEGQRISAGSFLISARASEMRAAGDRAEAKQYGLAEELAVKNEEFTRQSTAIQMLQAERANEMVAGTTRAATSANGFQLSGSALDVLKSNAQQGALTVAMAGQQGLITEAGYREEAKSYGVMGEAARTAAGFEGEIAGMEREQYHRSMNLADKTDLLAKQTERNGYISGGIKAGFSVASIFMPGA